MTEEEQDPGLRIQQIDAEMADLQQSIDRVAQGKDESSAERRAELNERMQQLKAEKNQLLREQDAQG